MPTLTECAPSLPAFPRHSQWKCPHYSFLSFWIYCQPSSSPYSYLLVFNKKQPDNVHHMNELFSSHFSFNVFEENISYKSLFLSFSFWQPPSDCPHHLRSSWGSDVSLEWEVLFKGYTNLIFTAKADSFIQATKNSCGPNYLCRVLGIQCDGER